MPILRTFFLSEFGPSTDFSERNENPSVAFPPRFHGLAHFSAPVKLFRKSTGLAFSFLEVPFFDRMNPSCLNLSVKVGPTPHLPSPSDPLSKTDTLSEGCCAFTCVFFVCLMISQGRRPDCKTPAPSIGLSRGGPGGAWPSPPPAPPGRRRTRPPRQAAAPRKSGPGHCLALVPPFPPPQAVGWRTIIGLPIPWWRFRPNWEKRHELFPYSRFQTVVITFETSTSILEQDQKVLVATSVGVPNETPRESTILHSGNKNASRFRPTLWIWSCTSFPLK